MTSSIALRPSGRLTPAYSLIWCVTARRSRLRRHRVSDRVERRQTHQSRLLPFLASRLLTAVTRLRLTTTQLSLMTLPSRRNTCTPMLPLVIHCNSMRAHGQGWARADFPHVAETLDGAHSGRLQLASAARTHVLARRSGEKCTEAEQGCRQIAPDRLAPLSGPDVRTKAPSPKSAPGRRRDECRALQSLRCVCDVPSAQNQHCITVLS